MTMLNGFEMLLLNAEDAIEESENADLAFIE